ncbi:MAG: cytochrome c oxidase accessory protein CcoG [Methylophilaceae bacterium]
MNSTIDNSTESETTQSDQIISLYEAQEKVYSRSISGPLTKWRWIMVWLTQLFFYGMPWIQWGERQALLFNLESKQFFIYGFVFYPQDLIYLTLLLIISALSLFLFTAVAGRLWCGYTCPQTVYTEIFMWVETKIEGDRAARMKLDDGTMSSKKLTKKTSKHFVWAAIALWTGFTFVGYFTPIRELLVDALNFSVSGWNTFWILFYGLATYGNAGFLREQVCKYMCPYARFQSVMFDDDTLTVTYDEARGEPRGRRSRKEAALVESKSIGACIECTFCVQVCPTGIDIREGMQIECIGCGACADACDSVMDKMNYPRGLIKYSTVNGTDGHWSKKQMLTRIFRPRVLIYTAVLWLLIAGVATSLYYRDDFRVNVARDRGLARLDGSMVKNVYRLQIMNATEVAQNYQISAKGLNDMVVGMKSGGSGSNQSVLVNPAEMKSFAVSLKVPDGTAESGSHKISFVVKMLGNDDEVTEESTFLVPR